MKRPNPDTGNEKPDDRNRLDKWLWAARFFKTRALAAEEIARGRVDVNGITAKASRELREGDTIEFLLGQDRRTIAVRGLSRQRGPASVAQSLYEETPESIARRADLVARRRNQPEPADSIEQGRPTKRNRRTLVDWTRWQASIDSN